MQIYRNVLVTVCLAGAMSSTVWAQSGDGIIFGTVTDPSGAVVSTAQITATNAATGISEKVTTDQSGNYVIPDLPATTYNITCEAVGFRTLQRTGILLQVDQRARVDLAMEVGQAQQMSRCKGT